MEREMEENENSFIFGAFIFKSITKEPINDPNAFLFTFMDNKEQIITLKESKRNESYIKVKKSDEKLLTIGNNKLIIGKKN